MYKNTSRERNGMCTRVTVRKNIFLLSCKQMMGSKCSLLFMTLLFIQCQAQNRESSQNQFSCLESIDFSVSRIVDSQILAPDDLSNDLGRSVCGRSSIPKPFKYFCKASDYFHKVVYNPTSAIVVLLSDMVCVLARSILAADEKFGLSVAYFQLVHKISDYSGISCHMERILQFAKNMVYQGTNLTLTFDKMVGLSGFARRAGAVLIALLRFTFQLALEGLDKFGCSDFPSSSQIPNPQGAAIIASTYLFNASIVGSFVSLFTLSGFFLVACLTRVLRSGCAGVRWLPSCISVLILYGGIFVTLVAIVPKDAAIAAISAMYGFAVLMWSSCAVLIFAKAMIGSALMISMGSYTATVIIWRLIFLLVSFVGCVVTGIAWVSVVCCVQCAQVAMLVATTTWNIVSKCAEIAFTAAAWAAAAIVRTAVIIEDSTINATVAGWTALLRMAGMTEIALLWMAGMMQIIWTSTALACTQAVKAIHLITLQATGAVLPAWLWMVSVAGMAWLAATVSAAEAAFQLSKLATFFQRECEVASNEYFQWECEVASKEHFKCMSCLELLAIDDLGMQAVDCACENGRQMCRNCQAGWVDSKVGEQVFPVPCAGGCRASIGQREVKCVVDDATWRRSV